MSWIVFTYSLPSKSSSSPRVAVWRRLRRMGAIALNGLQILPERDDCLEAFQWLAQEVRQANGEALIMRVERFEDVSDQSIVEKFRAACWKDYTQLEAEVTSLEATLAPRVNDQDWASFREALEKLNKQQAEIRRVDFFDCPEGRQLAARLKALAQALSPPISEVTIAPKAIELYRDITWVTRPRPHVDRLACIWLIRRFIDPNATIRYAKQVAEGEVGFDMSTGELQHQGNLCTFEVMTRTFGLADAGLQTLGEIVHELDLRDGLYLHPQTAGVEALLRGWLLADFSDTQLEAQGIALFEGLYAASLQDAASAGGPQPTTQNTRSGLSGSAKE